MDAAVRAYTADRSNGGFTVATARLVRELN